MKKYLIAGMLFVLAAVSVTCRNRYDERGASAGPAIIWGSIGDATYLNPILASDTASSDINDLVFNGLVKYDKELVLTGDLAETWDVADGGRKIIFHLRRGVRWHDGEDFDAEDVKYTFELLTATATRTPRSSRYEMVKSLTVSDRYTLAVEYSSPYSPALESWGIGILPEHLYRGTDVNTNPHNREPVGTGPYKFVSWKTDDRIILSANHDYFEGPPGIERVVYKIIPDQSVQFLELQKGTLDWMSPTPDQWVQETGKEDFRKNFDRYRYPSFSYTYMGYNLSNGLFSDVRVRKAICHAVDRQGMIDSVLQGLGRMAAGPYPPSSWAYNIKVNIIDYNREKANKLLEECGWKKNPKTGILEKDGKVFSFTLMTNQGNNTRKLTCEIIQSQLKEVGIDVRVRIQEWSSFINQYIDKKQFDAVLLGWSLPVDPDQYSIWHSSQMGEGQFNFVGYSNPEVDRLLEEGRSEFDMGKRKKIYAELQRIISEEQPYLFLYVADSMQVLQNRFRNVKAEKAGISYNFIEWYVPEELRRY
ncbi:MAG: peptide-binding protein [Elusimicrobia bacterium]|nr:peptide-binding protein [Elusimicrobiota bacterium]